MVHFSVGKQVFAGDPYFGGKQMAKLARLALIADEIAEEDRAQAFRDKARNENPTHTDFARNSDEK